MLFNCNPFWLQLILKSFLEHYCRISEWVPEICFMTILQLYLLFIYSLYILFWQNNSTAIDWFKLIGWLVYSQLSAHWLLDWSILTYLFIDCLIGLFSTFWSLIAWLVHSQLSIHWLLDWSILNFLIINCLIGLFSPIYSLIAWLVYSQFSDH